MFSSEPSKTGVVIVDHGSRKEESNRRLEQFVELFRSRTDYRVVEPAHMELASPSIEEAFGSCVRTGVSSILLVPFFLLPGRHWQEDLPRLARLASETHGSVPYMLSAPIGVHEGLVDILRERMETCLQQEVGEYCDLCNESANCRVGSSQQN